MRERDTNKMRERDTKHGNKERDTNGMRERNTTH